jgi:hypothetical protein
MDRVSLTEAVAIVCMVVIAIAIFAIELELHALVQNGVGLAMVMPESSKDD